MEKYNVCVSGSVINTETDFRCGFHFTVDNGGSFGEVGAAIQSAVDKIKGNGHPVPTPEPEK